MGSEMCIRDRSKHDFEQLLNNLIENAVKYRANHIDVKLDFSSQINICLLYTSDAADDSLRVDLGGRRIIKKKKKKKNKTTRVCVLFFFFCLFFFCFFFFFFFQAEDGIRDRSPSRGLGDVYKRQVQTRF